jgi:enoyl-[acyl-carrier protein] reductase II
MLAAEALGADGVQIGTLFAASKESSAHKNFKNRLVGLKEGETILTLKNLTPVRLIKNKFYQQVAEAEMKGASVDSMRQMLGRGRAKEGIFEGDLDNGELEIGQAASFIREVKSAAEILDEILKEYNHAKTKLLERKSE